MKRLTAWGCSVVLLLVSGLANAGAESGLYIGGSTGSSEIDVSSDGIDFNDSDSAYKVFAGFNFGIIPLVDVAVEGSYVDFGKASSSKIGNNDVGITGWDIFALAGFKAGPFGFFAKLGQISWASDSDVSALDDSGTDTAYGVGVRFQIASIAVRAEYEVFETGVADIGFTSLGAAWTF